MIRSTWLQLVREAEGLGETPIPRRSMEWLARNAIVDHHFSYHPRGLSGPPCDCGAASGFRWSAHVFGLWKPWETFDSLVGDLRFSLEISPAQPPRLALSKARIDVASFSTWQQGLVPKLGNLGGWLKIEWRSTVYIKYKYIRDNEIMLMIIIVIMIVTW